MASKELGMIHTANFTSILDSSRGNGLYANFDLSSVLTSQLQRLVRSGQFFKVVGIDMSLDTVGTVGGGQITGELRYYAPTRGRCAAFRDAFKAMREQMDIQGIQMSDNKLYDFKVPLTPSSGAGGFGNVPFSNQATLDGVEGLVFTDPLELIPGREILGVYNRSQQPQYTGTAGEAFPDGFDTLLGSDSIFGREKTDFVLNDTVPYTGDENVASEEFETIPFMVAWSPDNDADDSKIAPVEFEWRPDPALYLAVLTGQFDLYIEEINMDAGATELNLNTAIHVSGWKSIMGSPDSKKGQRSHR